MQTLPSLLYTPESIRRIDQKVIHEHAIPGYTLMRRAGGATLDVIVQHWPLAKKILVICGSGNNAGDGYVIARLAQQQGLTVNVVALTDPDRLRSDARLAYQQWSECGELSAAETTLIDEADIIVDAILGTGLTRDVEGLQHDWIETINTSGKLIVSVDVPSGLDALTGSIKGIAVNADITITFIALKMGLFTASGKACCGEVIFDSLGVTENMYEDEQPVARLLSLQDCKLPIRRHDSHKGLYGHVLVVGGNNGMPGAVILTARAALRAGAGMVTVVTRPAHVAAIATACPEAMVFGSENGNLPDLLLENISVVAIGPGLGKDAWANRLLSQAIALKHLLILDADALNLVAENRPYIEAPHIITPHPGEAAHLLSIENTYDIQLDRRAAVTQLYELMGGVVVLKGSGTMIFDGGLPGICPLGNPAMAVAGMGDVLTGVIAAFVAQGMTLKQAASAGVCVHARAGDMAAVSGTRGMMSSEVVDTIRQVLGNV